MRQATEEERQAMRAPRKPESFLCSSCSKVMCEDCRSIAEEYQDLLARRTNALSAANAELEETKFELERWKRRATMFEDVATAGIPAVIVAWIDQEIDQLVRQHAGVGEDRLYRTAQALLDFHDQHGPDQFQMRFGSLGILVHCAQIVAEGEGNPHPWPGQNTEHSA